jgi:hypothetical protein
MRQVKMGENRVCNQEKKKKKWVKDLSFGTVFKGLLLIENKHHPNYF